MADTPTGPEGTVPKALTPQQKSERYDTQAAERARRGHVQSEGEKKFVSGMLMGAESTVPGVGEVMDIATLFKGAHTAVTGDPQTGSFMMAMGLGGLAIPMAAGAVFRKFGDALVRAVRRKELTPKEAAVQMAEKVLEFNKKKISPHNRNLYYVGDVQGRTGKELIESGTAKTGHFTTILNRNDPNYQASLRSASKKQDEYNRWIRAQEESVQSIKDNPPQFFEGKVPEDFIITPPRFAPAGLGDGLRVFKGGKDVPVIVPEVQPVHGAAIGRLGWDDYATTVMPAGHPKGSYHEMPARQDPEWKLAMEEVDAWEDLSSLRPKEAQQGFAAAEAVTKKGREKLAAQKLAEHSGILENK